MRAFCMAGFNPGGGTPILCHIRDVRPEWVNFPGQKSADGCKSPPKTCGCVIILIHKTSGLVTFSIILPGNVWFSCKLNKTYCNLGNFGSCFIVHSLAMGLFLLIDGPALVCDWVNFPVVWLHTPVQTKLK